MLKVLALAATAALVDAEAREFSWSDMDTDPSGWDNDRSMGSSLMDKIGSLSTPGS